MKRKTLLILWLMALTLAPRWGFAQDDRFSGRTSNYVTPDIGSSSWTTSWQTKSGSISAGVYDRYDCYLTQGNTYEFNVCSELGGGGDANFDTYMALRQGYGDYASGITWLAYNDDGCSNNHSTITYTHSAASGWTSLFIAAYGSGTSGTYTLAYRQKPNTPTYTVTTNASPSGAGSVTGGGSYQQGSNCTLTATANTGFSFVRWEKGGSSVSTSNPYTFTVSETATYTAVFALPIPVITQATPVPQCGIGDATLTASLPGGETPPSDYAYYWYSNAACTSEITSGVSGTINNTLTYPANENTTVYCRLEKRVAGTTTVPQTFSYTDNNMYTYTVPEGATSLTLEVWGAQGGSYSSSYSGGYGGYSKGTLNNPTAGTTLYVVVGGQGGTNTSTPSTGGAQITGGYNGGGNSIVHFWNEHWSLPQAGGGATHIATRTGVLSSLSSYQSDVLIVAGGGSGSVYCYDGSTYRGFSGYAGGGPTSSAYNSTYQATQSAAGTGGSFGQGASYTSGSIYKFGPSGAGGGWYGGGCIQSHSDTYSEELVSGHGGGSGYIK